MMCEIVRRREVRLKARPPFFPRRLAPIKLLDKTNSQLPSLSLHVVRYISRPSGVSAQHQLWRYERVNASWQLTYPKLLVASDSLPTCIANFLARHTQCTRVTANLGVNPSCSWSHPDTISCSSSSYWYILVLRLLCSSVGCLALLDVVARLYGSRS